MKKLIVVSIILGAFLSLAPCFAADTPGTCTQSIGSYSTAIQVVTFTCTAGSAGAYPSTATNASITAAIKGWWIQEVRTNPGSGPPTDLYDIVLNDSDGIDLMGGTMADRSTTVSQAAIPAPRSAVYGPRPLDGAITLVMTNNSQAGAITVVKVFLSK